ncbi:DUF4296 domain-containing protein [Parapedobacter sp. ISTM3]|uniref:DUF4296 domain-containing protein n=1 Tax=Parapedobacter sp. ISTM3 TaxID=2800130 RepID=UPI0019081ECA|nr:DUF4296 domain-containing protein [Parapedobacter sp. ISTM3]MBK1440317.1 DUF4296 domain-containing protein [Parapedobacter sp. ISTM3]
MQRLLTGITILFLCISCGEKIPDGIIPSKRMPDVLLDVHLADGQLMAMPIDSARAYRDSYYQAIFDRWGIDSAVFRRSVEYYSTRPRIMNELYITVEKRLEALNLAEQKAVEEKYNLQRRADSIINVRRLDSLQRIASDSLDFKRKRFLLFLHAPDSIYGAPHPITHEMLHDRLLESIGLSQMAIEGQNKVMPRGESPRPPQPQAKSTEASPVLRPIEKIK